MTTPNGNGYGNNGQYEVTVKFNGDGLDDGLGDGLGDGLDDDGGLTADEYTEMLRLAAEEEEAEMRASGLDPMQTESTGPPPQQSQAEQEFRKLFGR